jgi:Abortive infection alpha
MDKVTEIAKAVGKTADFGTQALQTSEKAGGFIAGVFKEPIEQSMGILCDRIRLARLRRLDEMADEVNEILSRRGMTDTRAVSLKVGVPLLDEAALEEEPELKRLWSNLLANAMDPAFTSEMRVAYTEILRNLSPMDARVLALMYNSLRQTGQLTKDDPELVPFHMVDIATKLENIR